MSLPRVKHRCPKRRFRQRCAEAFGVPEHRVIGARHLPDVVLARHAVAYGLYHKHGLNFCQIGALLGGRHHTTIRYGIEKFQQRLNEDPEIARKMAKLKVEHSNRLPQRGRPV